MADQLPAEQTGPGTAVTNYEERWKREAQQESQRDPKGGAPYISIKGGVMTFNGQALPGNQLAGIVLDSWFENTLYANAIDPNSAYDDDDPSPPICYAFSRSNADMAPHPSMQEAPEYFVPQASACEGCEYNKWGSALRGRGKACQNRRRLTILPGGYYTPRKGTNDFDLTIYEDPAYYAEANIAFMRLPVTSTSVWSDYVSMLNATLGRPPYAVMTRIGVVPDPKTQYRMTFELLAPAPDFLAGVLIKRHDGELEMVPKGFDAPDPNAAPRRGPGGYGARNMRGFQQQGQTGGPVYGQPAAPPPRYVYDAQGNTVDTTTGQIVALAAQPPAGQG